MCVSFNFYICQIFYICCKSEVFKSQVLYSGEYLLQSSGYKHFYGYFCWYQVNFLFHLCGSFNSDVNRFIDS